jgi:hypothetical protein
MKSKVAILLIVLTMASTALAIGDISIGPFYGMSIPIANDNIKSGGMFGVQAKFAPAPFFAAGLHFQSRKFGDPSQTLFYGSDTNDGGKVSSFGMDAYIGKTSGIGPNFYFMASFGSYKWKRDNMEDISKMAYAFGPGMEIVLPMKLGIEGRGMLEVVPTGDKGSWKSFMWLIGLNYHIGLGVM